MIRALVLVAACAAAAAQAPTNDMMDAMASEVSATLATSSSGRIVCPEAGCVARSLGEDGRIFSATVSAADVEQVR